ncbi:reticulon-like protein B5 [Senna tora]|uniref:Reticulon-like protein n=1 Tax=Senna tora TaxID=362788 RepID=A0A834U2I4_9FABA|nr:reticulon-like protein B5 [Senna tora]
MLEQLELLDVADSEFLSSSDDDELDDDESDSESEIEKYFTIAAAKNRLFGRKRPLHVVLGAGQAADIILWRDKNVSASILAGITIIWFLFEGLGYNLLTLICHSLLLLLALLILWTSLGPSANMPPLELSELVLPDKMLANLALSLRYDVIQGFKAVGAIVFHQDLKNFLMVAVTLWGLSVVGAWVSFITFFYIVSVILLILPMVYEKHEDIIDIVGGKPPQPITIQSGEVGKDEKDMAYDLAQSSIGGTKIKGENEDDDGTVGQGKVIDRQPSLTLKEYNKPGSSISAKYIESASIPFPNVGLKEEAPTASRKTA